MLSESSYLAALYTYLGASVVMLIYTGWWLARHWRAGWVALAVLLCAALLLTPAYPREGVSTFAPAVIVAAFQFMTAGVEGASHALRPLAAACGLAVVLAILLRLSVFRRSGKKAAKKPAGKPPAAKSAGQAGAGRRRAAS